MKKKVKLTPEQRQKRREYQRKWYLANKEKTTKEKIPSASVNHGPSLAEVVNAYKVLSKVRLSPRLKAGLDKIFTDAIRKQ